MKGAVIYSPRLFPLTEKTFICYHLLDESYFSKNLAVEFPKLFLLYSRYCS